MTQQHIDLFSSAYDQCKRMLSLFSNNAALLSIQKQLDYLLTLAKREITVSCPDSVRTSYSSN